MSPRMESGSWQDKEESQRQELSPQWLRKNLMEDRNFELRVKDEFTTQTRLGKRHY